MSLPIAILIPAYNPTPALTSLVDDLLAAGLGPIMVVNDASDKSFDPIFISVMRPSVTVFPHAWNQGKGAALKTGFYQLLQQHRDLAGIVTADADGQHLSNDVIAIARALAADPTRPILGVRTLSGSVPLRSLAGNRLARIAFFAVSGHWFTDTQTGLRGIPIALAPNVGCLDGERFAYETKVLGYLCRCSHPPREIPISTVYFDNNRNSTFRPVRDSLAITAAHLNLLGKRLLRRP